MRKPLHHNQAHQPDRHGFRGTPPPAAFSLTDLPDDALLTEYEAASVGRWSTNTLGAWRRDPEHPLKWEVIGGRYVRYRVGNMKCFLALGRQTKPGAKPKAAKSTRPAADKHLEVPREQS